jgi:hypothetical protein
MIFIKSHCATKKLYLLIKENMIFAIPAAVRYVQNKLQEKSEEGKEEEGMAIVLLVVLLGIAVLYIMAFMKFLKCASGKKTTQEKLMEFLLYAFLGPLYLIINGCPKPRSRSRSRR